MADVISKLLPFLLAFNTVLVLLLPIKGFAPFTNKVNAKLHQSTGIFRIDFMFTSCLPSWKHYELSGEITAGIFKEIRYAFAHVNSCIRNLRNFDLNGFFAFQDTNTLGTAGRTRMYNRCFYIFTIRMKNKITYTSIEDKPRHGKYNVGSFELKLRFLKLSPKSLLYWGQLPE